MMYADEVTAGWFYLSHIEDNSMKEKVFHDLERKVSVIPEAYRNWYDYYLDYYRNYETFPAWTSFKEMTQMENECSLTIKEAQSLYQKSLAVWESDSLAERMKNLPLYERRTVVEKMSQLLASEVQESKPMVSSTSFNVEGTMIQTKNQEKSKFKFPIKHLNEITCIKPGNTITVMAGPGQGKTQFQESLCYINSVKNDMNTLCIYLENLPQSYMADILARYSFDTGTKIENASLKMGVQEDDESAVKAIKDLKADYDENKKGEIYFKPFSDYNTDPLRFGAELARDVSKYNIGLIVLDYIQRCKVFAPLKMDTMAYLNQLTSTIAQVALGGFEATHPSIAVILAQPNRDAMAKAERTKGNSYNTTSIAEVSAIERDSFLILALFNNPEGKAAGTLTYKVIKNRDGDTDISALTTPYLPQYCYIGDLVEGTDQNVYSSDVLNDVFDDLDL